MTGEREQGLIERLFIRARIRRTIVTRKSVQEGNPDRLAALLDEAGAGLVECLRALEPFAACAEQIDDKEDGEEWAKFRLLIKHYRSAAATYRKLHPKVTIPDVELPPEQPGWEQP